MQLKTKHKLWKTPIKQATKFSTITTSTYSLTQEYKYKRTQQITKSGYNQEYKNQESHREQTLIIK
jgi:hypothetical protein